MRRSILPLQALILGIAMNALYLGLFAEYFNGDIFSQLAVGSAFGIDIGFFEPLIFGVFTLLIVAAIGALSHYFNRKTILVFTSLVPVCLLIAGFGIIISFDDMFLNDIRFLGFFKKFKSLKATLFSLSLTLFRPFAVILLAKFAFLFGL